MLAMLGSVVWNRWLERTSKQICWRAYVLRTYLILNFLSTRLPYCHAGQHSKPGNPIRRGPTSLDSRNCPSVSGREREGRPPCTSCVPRVSHTPTHGGIDRSGGVVAACGTLAVCQEMKVRKEAPRREPPPAFA